MSDRSATDGKIMSYLIWLYTQKGEN